MILQPIDPNLRLPTAEELPSSDETPVDNERQNDIPNWLKAILSVIWAERQDWFFGVDMGIYDDEGRLRRTPIIPDGFLSIGVTRHKGDSGRLSYVLAEEDNIPPIFVLEYVSQTYNGEYEEKLHIYARMQVMYVVLYNPNYFRRQNHEPFEVYRLEGNRYRRCDGEPVWMPELGLGIGRVRGLLEGIEQEWLAWFDQSGTPYPLTFEMIDQLQSQLQQQKQQFEQERQRADAECQRAERLAERLRSLGLDPDET